MLAILDLIHEAWLYRGKGTKCTQWEPLYDKSCYHCGGTKKMHKI